MSQIIYSEQANIDLVRFTEFAQKVEPNLKKRIISTIFEGIEILQKFPKIAKQSEIEKYKHLRELFIPFGKAGYVVLYEYHEEKNIVLINSIRHAKEAGYKFQ